MSIWYTLGIALFAAIGTFLFVRPYSFLLDVETFFADHVASRDLILASPQLVSSETS